jgi:hypothetical protein
MTPSNPESGNTNTDNVGYCKPPKAHQFKKGQSGNPSGKRKTPNELVAIVHKVALQKASVIIDGITKKLTLFELFVRAPMAHGLKGNSKNVVQALSLTQAVGFNTGEKKQPLGVIYRDENGAPTINARFDFDALSAELESILRNNDFSISGAENTDLQGPEI